jgi:hypothetical protein
MFGRAVDLGSSSALSKREAIVDASEDGAPIFSH